jgi:hypothetical protein
VPIRLPRPSPHLTCLYIPPPHPHRSTKPLTQPSPVQPNPDGPPHLSHQLPRPPPHPRPPSRYNWMVFNDFHITPSLPGEVGELYGGQKLPCLLYFTQVEAVRRAAECPPRPPTPVLTQEGFLALCRMPPLQVWRRQGLQVLAELTSTCRTLFRWPVCCDVWRAHAALSHHTPPHSTPIHCLPPSAGPKGAPAQAHLRPTASQRAAPAGVPLCPGRRVRGLLAA